MLPLNVQIDFLPREVIGIGHSKMANRWELRPGELREATVTCGRTVYCPVVVLFFCLRSDYLAVYDTICLGTRLIEIFSWSQALPHIFFFIRNKPVFHIFYSLHFRMIFLENLESSISFEGVWI